MLETRHRQHPASWDGGLPSSRCLLYIAQVPGEARGNSATAQQAALLAPVDVASSASSSCDDLYYIGPMASRLSMLYYVQYYAHHHHQDCQKFITLWPLEVWTFLMQNSLPWHTPMNAFHRGAAFVWHASIPRCSAYSYDGTSIW